MADDTLPNPSFLVLHIPRPADCAAVEAAVLAELRNEDGEVLTPLGGERWVLSRAPAKQLLLGHPGRDELRGFLEGLPGVARVEPMPADRVATAMLAREPAPADAVAESQPDDEVQWNLAAVRAQRAWRMFPGGLRRCEWRDVRVGHIDTGYTRHDVFGPWQGHHSPILLPDQGIDYIDGGLPEDPLGYNGNPGHGTRTGSVLAGHLAGKLFGVAPKVRTVPYRVTISVVIDSFGNDTSLGAAIEHAVEESGCRVISISLGNPCLPRGGVTRAIDHAYGEGVIIVAAAGNVTQEITYPARYTRTICAAGSTRGDRPWAGSARGRAIDIAAPAAGIFRADAHPTRSDVLGGGGDGTSYATVHVAAAAVLWIAYHGDELSERYRLGWQRVEAFRKLIRETARRPRSWGDSAIWGPGILDIAALLDRPLPDPGDLVER